MRDGQEFLVHLFVHLHLVIFLFCSCGDVVGFSVTGESRAERRSRSSFNIQLTLICGTSGSHLTKFPAASKQVLLKGPPSLSPYVQDLARNVRVGVRERSPRQKIVGRGIF